MPPGWSFPHSFSGWSEMSEAAAIPTCCCLHRCPRARIPDAARGRCGHAAVRWRPPPAEPSLPAAPGGALTPQRRLGSLRARTFQLCPPAQVGTLMRFLTLLVSVCESGKWASCRCPLLRGHSSAPWRLVFLLRFTGLWNSDPNSGPFSCSTREGYFFSSPSFLPLFSLSCNPFPPFLLSFPSGKVGT